jgi:hypothetical protein
MTTNDESATGAGFAFTDEERAYFKEMRAITTDAEGREVLVGLTADETEFYMTFTRRFPANRDRNPEHRKRYRELHEKRERARLAVLGAEIQARNENPTRH